MSAWLALFLGAGVLIGGYAAVRALAAEAAREDRIAERELLENIIQDCGNWSPEDHASIQRAIDDTRHAIDLELWALEIAADPTDDDGDDR